jgi:hypothetical protein
MYKNKVSRTLLSITAILLTFPCLALAGEWVANGSAIYYDAGKVGIGTTSPVTKLAIASAVSGYTAMQTFDETGNNGVNSMGIDFRFGGSAGFPWGSGVRIEAKRPSTSAAFDLAFHTYGSSALAERMRITSTGNVGIGTTNPQSKLAVNGTITAREVKVTVTGWADYVFAEGYKLPSLNEVEAYIKENKHLPGVPTESAVKQDGLALSEIAALQMQKIEELTLYMIELKKENEQLNKRLAALESR